MYLRDIYQLAIILGIKNDLRGEEKVRNIIKKSKIKYERLGNKGKENFDIERLINPYSDTRILFDNGKPIKKILVGIDIEPAEILMAKQLGVDTVISHHPEGQALADLGDVIHSQAEIFALYGVPINVAEALTRERVSEVSRGVSSINHYRAVDTARLMDINFMCIHTPCDNLAASFLNKLLHKTKPTTVGEIIDALETVPEYNKAVKLKQGPKIFVGGPDSSAGKIALTEIAGGTSVAIGIYEKLAMAGIGTIIGMHMSESHKKEAQHFHINVVIAGHMSSDSLGVNQFLDQLEAKGISIIPCSGLIRVKRKSTMDKNHAKTNIIKSKKQKTRITRASGRSAKA